MSSVTRRIMIEEYVDGGFGVMDVLEPGFEEMGLMDAEAVLDSVSRAFGVRA